VNGKPNKKWLVVVLGIGIALYLIGLGTPVYANSLPGEELPRLSPDENKEARGTVLLLRVLAM